jgi:hypothetical protein
MWNFVASHMLNFEEKLWLNLTNNTHRGKKFMIIICKQKNLFEKTLCPHAMGKICSTNLWRNSSLPILLHFNYSVISHWRPFLPWNPNWTSFMSKSTFGGRPCKLFFCRMRLVQSWLNGNPDRSNAMNNERLILTTTPSSDVRWQMNGAWTGTPEPQSTNPACRCLISLAPGASCIKCI